MEKQNVKQTNTTVTFENLKQINVILQKGELNSILSVSKNAKSTLDQYAKRLLEQSRKMGVVQKQEPKVVEKAEVVQKPVVEQKRTTTTNMANANYRSQNNNYSRNNQTRDGRPQNNRFEQNGQRQNSQNDNKKNMARPQGQGRPAPSFSRPERPEKLDILQTKQERLVGNKNKTHKPSDDHDKKVNVKKDKFRFDFSVNEEDMDETGRMGRVRTKLKKATKPAKPIEKTVIENASITTNNLTVKILSEKIGKPATEIIKKFMLLGMMLNINSPIDFETAELVASEFGITLNYAVEQTTEEKVKEMFANMDATTEKRPPIVTVMGHVDHGKTSLLDYIRKTNVTSGEAGGITQHIGAYSIEVNNNKITFIDTPGHAAFTAMRQRGAQVTDLAILIVAADDGIMPQTVEAIHHIKDAKVPMIVAINKVDKPEANIERIKQQLTEHDVLPEEWGGEVICEPISAKSGFGIDKLLEDILLVADMEELKANSDVAAMGTVLEAKVDKGRGIVANIIVKNGTLHVGDYVACGTSYGKVRAMMDHTGKSIVKALPSTAVSMLGLDSVPDAGDIVYVLDEKMAKDLVAERINAQKVEKTKSTNGVNLEDFLSTPKDQVLKTYNILIKADVQGSAEALESTLTSIKNEEVKIDCVASSVGLINESDVLLAKASNAMIIGFNVKPDPKAKQLAERNGVEIKFYKIIYEAVDELKTIIDKMMTPKYEEKVIGRVEVRHIFKISAIGTIAGSYVLDGQVNRTSKVRVYRGKDLVTTADIASLQQGKDNAKTMKAGFECGIKLKDFDDIKEGDILEVFELVEIKKA